MGYGIQSHFQQYFSYIVAVSFIGGENHRSAASHGQTWSHNVVMSTPAWVGFALTTLVVIGTDCIGSCKSTYDTITATTAPVFGRYFSIFVNLHNFYEKLATERQLLQNKEKNNIFT